MVPIPVPHVGAFRIPAVGAVSAVLFVVVVFAGAATAEPFVAERGCGILWFSVADVGRGWREGGLLDLSVEVMRRGVRG